MDALKSPCAILSVLILNISCVSADNPPIVRSIFHGAKPDPVRAKKPVRIDSQAVEAAKQTLRQFMSAPEWRDREPEAKLHKAVKLLGTSGEAGIDMLEKLSTSNDIFLSYDAMRAIVRSGSKRGPAIVARYMAATRLTLPRHTVVWQIKEMAHLPRDMKYAYAKIIVAEIWRSRKPHALADESYLLDLVTTLEVLDGGTYLERPGTGRGIFCEGQWEYSTDDIQRAVRRCLNSYLSLTGIKTDLRDAP